MLKKITSCLKDASDHLHDQNEGYLQHMSFALRFSARLMLASLAVTLHAIFPFVCKSTGSRMLATLHNEVQERLHKNQK